jgi:hypothetical protein
VLNGGRDTENPQTRHTENHGSEHPERRRILKSEPIEILTKAKPAPFEDGSGVWNTKKPQTRSLERGIPKFPEFRIALKSYKPQFLTSCKAVCPDHTNPRGHKNTVNFGVGKYLRSDFNNWDRFTRSGNQRTKQQIRGRCDETPLKNGLFSSDAIQNPSISIIWK